MTKNHSGIRRSRVLYAAVLSTAMAATLTVFASSGSASASRPLPDVAPPPTAPTSANQIQNLGQVETAIKAYYGDTPQAATDPVTGLPTTLHFPSSTGAYAAEVALIEHKADRYLALHKRAHMTNQAIVFDIDDTTLNTYNYEIYSGFNYNPTTNAAFVNTAAFPAVFGMPALEAAAVAEGYKIFFITGRPITQTTGTETNLTNVGYTFDPSQVYLKDTSASWLVPCGGSACTTDQYKSLTRGHIESLGFHIVANFGDQFSDLSGGFADQTFKMPNPMYFLP
jgi:hypothetical protein